MANIIKRKGMKERVNQTLIVILLLAAITGIVAYSWTGLLDLMEHFNNTLSEKLLYFNIF